jgi:hypothetical protein
MYTDQAKEFNGEYVVVWNEQKQITFGPEIMYGTLFCPINFYYSINLSDVVSYIQNNNLTLPNSETSLPLE